MFFLNSLIRRSLQENGDVDYSEEGLVGLAYLVVASLIFFFVAFNFLFPVNSLIPLDRRTTSVLGTLLCYLTRAFVFKLIDEEGSSFLLDAIDFDVFVLLTSIMVINHLFVHLRETRKVIEYLQDQIKQNPVRGFWMVSLAAFTISPFLTNDGVCLLFVEPILNAFDDCVDENDTDFSKHEVSDKTFDQRVQPLQEIKNGHGNTASGVKSKLALGDCLYFLLALACSSNIGSALTYTGNPQNMIVASDSIGVLPSYKFLLYMLIPSVTGWLITTLVIQSWWTASQNANRMAIELDQQNPMSLAQGSDVANDESVTDKTTILANLAASNSTNKDGAILDLEDQGNLSLSTSYFLHQPSSTISPDADVKKLNVQAKNTKQVPKLDLSICGCGATSGSVEDHPTAVMPFSPSSSSYTRHLSTVPLTSPPSAGKRKKREHEQLMKKVVHVISSPAPYIVLILMVAMIIMIFVDIMPISSLICVSSVIMVLVVVIGNHWRNQKIWTVYEMGEDSSTTPLVPSTTQALAPGRSERLKRARRLRKNNGSNESNGSNGSHLSRSHPSRSSSDGSGYYSQAGDEAAERENDVTNGPVGSSSNGLTGDNNAILSHDDKTANLQEFFEAMFNSIDYSLLVIFMGLFVVVGNLEATGLPKFIWDKIVGARPFKSIESIVGISLFVLIASQLIGNVAVVQLAKPNITYLDDESKRVAWAIISYVATVGGNLTITGSAANIIVAEKALRLDPNMEIDFFAHYKVCFWVTLFVCALGGAMLFGISSLDTIILSYF